MMILEGEIMQARMPVNPGRKSAVRGRAARKGAADKELIRLEREIAELMRNVRALADELGAGYAVFRSEAANYGCHGDLGHTRLLELSRATDECIDRIYRLEHRRCELLNKDTPSALCGGHLPHRGGLGV
jgi:hypothetical protein